MSLEVGGWGIEARFSSSPQDPSGDPFTADLDLEAITARPSVRARLPGDRFQPAGMHGRKKLQDFFTDARVPRDWRNRVPLLVAERGIAWVVGYRIAHWARVDTSSTGVNQVIEVTFSYKMQS